MQLVRNRLAVVPWYTHISSVPTSFRAIQREGLRTMDPGGIAPAEVRSAIGPGGQRILCLFPSGAQITRPSVDRGEPRFMIAVEGMDLPANVGLDWSFPNCWALGLHLRMETQVLPPTES